MTSCRFCDRPSDEWMAPVIDDETLCKRHGDILRSMMAEALGQHRLNALLFAVFTLEMILLFAVGGMTFCLFVAIGLGFATAEETRRAAPIADALAAFAEAT